jgi:hypothetical protein
MIQFLSEEFIKNCEDFKTNLDKDFEKLKIELQNIQSISQVSLPTNIPNIYSDNIEFIKLFKTKGENIIKFYNESIVKKEFNIQDIIEKIKEVLNNIFNHYNEINDYKKKCENKNISENDSNKLLKLFDKYKKNYEKCFNDLTGEIKNLIFLLKTFVDYINNLKSEVINQKTTFESIFKNKNILQKQELNQAMFSSYTNFVECFETIKSILDQIKIFINKNNSFKKLKAVQDRINKTIIEKKLNMPKFDFNKVLDKINLFDQLKKNNYIENLYIPNLCIEKMKFNILFIFDITSSMGTYIELFNKNYFKIIKEIKKNCPLALFYLGFIGYKDINDLELGDEYIDIDFTLLYEEIYKRIKDIQAEGGDDIPEDVAGAFEMALNKSWNKGTNIIFLITESPCHGTKYHDLDQNVEAFKDSFPKENYGGNNDVFKRRSIETIVEEFVNMNFNLICPDIHENTQKMFKMFEEKYNSKNKSELFSISKEDLVHCIIQKVCLLYSQEEGEILKNLKEDKSK